MNTFWQTLSAMFDSFVQRMRGWGKRVLGAHPWATASVLMLLAAMLLWAAHGEEVPGPPPAGSDVVYRCTADGQMILKLTAPQAGTYYARVNAKACILAAFPQT